MDYWILSLLEFENLIVFMSWFIVFSYIAKRIYEKLYLQKKTNFDNFEFYIFDSFYWYFRNMWFWEAESRKKANIETKFAIIKHKKT